MIASLRRELTRAGIVVEPGRRRAVVENIQRRGRSEFKRLGAEAGLPVETIRKSAVAAMGRGSAITEFALAGVPVAEEFRDDAASLGGLATLIVSGFDAILDSGDIPPEIALGGQVQPAEGRDNLKRRILTRLVELYYRRLAAFPDGNAAVRRTIDRAIERMYRAELQSARPNAGRSVWWRKNALPFVVMGAPGWLATAHWSAERFRRHLAWLGRLGEFLGWVDDCVDLEEDRSQGQVSRVLERLTTTTRSVLSGNIARQGGRVLREWDAANPSRRVSPIRDTFAVIVWSWIDSAEGQRTGQSREGRVPGGSTARSS